MKEVKKDAKNDDTDTSYSAKSQPDVDMNLEGKGLYDLYRHTTKLIK